MRRLLATCALTITLILASALPAAASAGVGLPLTAPATGTTAPPGFTSTADEAAAAAKATRQMQALHAHQHPLFVQPLIWAGRRWWVAFSYHGRQVAEVDVSPAGKVTAVWTGPLAITVYARGHFAPIFDSPWVLIGFGALFLVPFIDLRRLRRIVHLDALMILSFFVSYGLFDHAHLETAVWLAYPPLIYFLLRMAWIGLRGRGRSRGVASLSDPRILAAGLLALVGARVGLSLANREVIDVGYASVIGAHRLAHGQALYYAAAQHGDTYGPIMFLAYLPFELLFPWHGSWDYLPAAHAASIGFDLVTIAGLVALGRRLRPGRAGTRLGLTLGWAWAACPFTLLGLMMHTNDGLVAMLCVLALLVFASPAARGAVLGLAVAAKFTPAVLLPVFASPRERGWRGTAACGAAFTLVVLAAIGLYLPSGGVTEFYNHTIGYQLSRSDVFSPWALHPGLSPIKTAIEVAVAVFAVAVAFVPRERSFVQVCALCAAVTIAIELPALHWFYYYLVWFLPFVFVVLLSPAHAAGVDAAPPPAALRVETEPDAVSEPALAGV